MGFGRFASSAGLKLTSSSAASRYRNETVQYVANISKYYIAYRMIAEQGHTTLNSEAK